MLFSVVLLSIGYYFFSGYLVGAHLKLVYLVAKILALRLRKLNKACKQ